MALVFTVTTTVIVESKERWKHWIITAGFCAICFLAGIICLLPVSLLYRSSVYLDPSSSLFVVRSTTAVLGPS